MALLLHAEELMGLVSLEEAISAVEQAFRDQGENQAFSLPRQRMLAKDRRISVHSGGCVSLGVAGTFIHYERFQFTKEDQSYAAVGKRVYVAYDSENAKLLTVIIGSLPFFEFDPAEDVFATETAITSAVGTKYLARTEARAMGLFGTGRQARRHLKAMCAIRPIEQVKVFSRSKENRRAFCNLMQRHAAAELRPVESPQEAAKDVDLIVCATGSNVPVLFGEWLEPGVHVTSIVGSNKELLAEGLVTRPRREIDDSVLSRADLIVATLVRQAIQDEQGDLFEPVNRGLLRWEEIKDLGALVAGKANGRTDDRQITLFKQNSDQGVGYMALARLVHDKARLAGIGIEI
ncbi:MAG: ornithine cyclodeaminase family protein [Candidatus Binatia bacterium]